MVTVGFGVCLVISIMATLLIAMRSDDHVNGYDWSISILLPFLIMGYWLKTQTASQEAALVLFVFINLSSTVLLAVILFSTLRHLAIPVSPWLKFTVYGAAFAQLFPVWMTFRQGLPDDYSRRRAQAGYGSAGGKRGAGDSPEVQFHDGIYKHRRFSEVYIQSAVQTKAA